MACAWTSLNCQRDDQAFLRFLAGAAGADERDHLVEVVERLEEAFEDVGALFGLAQVEARAADDDLLRCSRKCRRIVRERHDLRLVVDDRQEDDAERGLHLRVATGG